MIKRDIIDTEKRTLAENLTELTNNVCIGFTVAMTAVLALGTCFADGATKQGIYYCWGILAVCIATPLLQLVFFTPTMIKRMTYPMRLALFSACLYALLCILAILLGWFPTNNPAAWTTFTVVFFAILALLTLVFTAKLNRDTREMNEKLAEYRKSMGEK